MKKVVVAGASGLVGRGAIRAFLAAGDWEVIAVSRRKPDGLEGIRHIAADLFDTQACAKIFSGLGDVTHLVYAALYEKDDLVAGWLDPEQITRNDQMLRNLFEPLSGAAKNLRHVSLLQGTKAYGAHVRPIPVSAREDRDEFKSQANFYWNQESYLREKQKGQNWHWTILRPQIIFGDALGAAMNPIAAIGVYGALLKEKGEPLHFPGGADNVLEGVDADLLGRAIKWAAENDAAHDQAFNVTNGDVMVWRNLWPAIADALGMARGDDRPLSLAASLPPRAAEWDAIRKKYALAAPALADFAGKSLAYADFIMAYGSERSLMPAIVSTIKLRQAGFTEVMDSEAMMRKWIADLQAHRLLPPR